MDPSGAIFEENVLTIGLDRIEKLKPGSGALTGHKLTEIGEDQVVEYKSGCCWCAQVVDSKIFHLRVDTYLPLFEEVYDKSVTLKGWQGWLDHEARRREVNAKGYNSYLMPASYSLPKKCGVVCHEEEGFAKFQLELYLITIRDEAERAFVDYDKLQQAFIGAENNERLNVDGKNVEEFGGLFDHFGYIHEIHEPKEIKWTKCPKSTCPK